MCLQPRGGVFGTRVLKSLARESFAREPRGLHHRRRCLRFRRLRPGEVTGPAKLPTPPGLAPNPAGPPTSSTPWAHSPKPCPPPTLSSDPSGAFTPPTLSSEPTRPPTPPTPNHGRTQALLSHRHYQQTHLASPPHLHYRRLRPPDLGAWVRFQSASCSSSSSSSTFHLAVRSNFAPLHGSRGSHPSHTPGKKTPASRPASS